MLSLEIEQLRRQIAILTKNVQASMHEDENVYDSFSCLSHDDTVHLNKDTLHESCEHHSPAQLEADINIRFINSPYHRSYLGVLKSIDTSKLLRD